ncbi:MAG: NADH:flavin oxidoreductase [Candidatus Zixiibacteriota bacterium]|nr:MAG: NADH:flavin oxidoreductase [candidate division Zixibacteria bacterium]
MKRNNYKVFSQGRIGSLTLSNHLVRSATWDPSILHRRRMNNEVLNLYRELARGDVGLIITGDFSVVPKGMLDEPKSGFPEMSYADVRIEGLADLAEEVHASAPDCKILAQVSGEYPGVGPSNIPSPFSRAKLKPLSPEQIQAIVNCFIQAIGGVKQDGFDGVQLHAAHGGLLSRFLSPYTNRREDQYGGSVENRARVIRDIIIGARKIVGDFPILIKMNCTDYVEGGTDIDTFPELARAIERSGVDAIEISGGMWDCLVRTEDELGFRPVPAPESHTRIKSPGKQSYFLKFAEKLNLAVPLILVGGNRDIERLEETIGQGKVDFFALCRPLISEPGLPKRWLEGRGSGGTDCISCNACIYDMWTHLEEEKPWVAACLVKHDRKKLKIAEEWLSSWVKKNVVS